MLFYFKKQNTTRKYRDMPASEYSLLLDILTIKNDKRKFNLKYNNLIKLIRKNINRINNKNKGD